MEGGVLRTTAVPVLLLHLSKGLNVENEKSGWLLVN